MVSSKNFDASKISGIGVIFCYSIAYSHHSLAVNHYHMIFRTIL